MKKLIALITIILINWTAFSQIGINNSEIKCFPISVVKKITQDLLRGDSAKYQLLLSEKEIVEMGKKIQFKDSVILKLNDKQKNFITSINLQNEKYDKLQDYTNKVELRLEKLQKTNRLTIYTSCFLFGIIVSSFLLN